MGSQTRLIDDLLQVTVKRAQAPMARDEMMKVVHMIEELRSFGDELGEIMEAYLQYETAEQTIMQLDDKVARLTKIRDELAGTLV